MTLRTLSSAGLRPAAEPPPRSLRLGRLLGTGMAGQVLSWPAEPSPRQTPSGRAREPGPTSQSPVSRSVNAAVEAILAEGRLRPRTDAPSGIWACGVF